MNKNLLGIISVDLDAIDQLLITYFALVRYRRRSGSVMGQYMSYLQILRRHIVQLVEKYCTMFTMKLVYQ
jgi:hypothetical protein